MVVAPEFAFFALLGAYRVINVTCSFLSSQNSGFKRPIFTYLGSLERRWPVDGSEHNVSFKKNCVLCKLQKNIVERAYHPIFNRYLYFCCVLKLFSEYARL
jgi:hypothetical protein